MERPQIKILIIFSSASWRSTSTCNTYINILTYDIRRTRTASEWVHVWWGSVVAQTVTSGVGYVDYSYVYFGYKCMPCIHHSYIFAFNVFNIQRRQKSINKLNEFLHSIWRRVSTILYGQVIFVWHYSGMFDHLNVETLKCSKGGWVMTHWFVFIYSIDQSGDLCRFSRCNNTFRISLFWFFKYNIGKWKFIPDLDEKWFQRNHRCPRFIQN